MRVLLKGFPLKAYQANTTKHNFTKSFHTVLLHEVFMNMSSVLLATLPTIKSSQTGLHGSCPLDNPPWASMLGVDTEAPLSHQRLARSPQSLYGNANAAKALTVFVVCVSSECCMTMPMAPKPSPLFYSYSFGKAFYANINASIALHVF